MKKILFSFLTLSLMTSLSFASCDYNKNDENNTTTCTKKIECESNKKCDNLSNKNSLLDDDEYLTNNQCFLDKRFKKMKKALCLTSEQECAINQLYKNFRADMENYHNRYRIEKNNIMKNIECDNCYSDDKYALKEIKKDIKQRIKCFKKDVEEQLCKEQIKEYKKFLKCEKKKMKKLVKYAPVMKFPCTDCSK